MKTETPIKTIIPKGKYYVGDPCYTIHDNEWSNVVRSMYDCESKFEDGKIVQISNGIQMCFTTDGDGYVMDENGKEYSIDSGCFGFVSFDHNPKIDMMNLVNLVDFKEDTVCSLEDGVLSFGDFKVGIRTMNW